MCVWLSAVERGSGIIEETSSPDCENVGLYATL